MDKKIKELERVMKALANKRRLFILKHLKKGELPVGEIADLINLSFPATSRHLDILSKADLVDSNQRSLRVFYKLSDSASPIVNRIIESL